MLNKKVYKVVRKRNNDNTPIVICECSRFKYANMILKLLDAVDRSAKRDRAITNNLEYGDKT